MKNINKENFFKNTFGVFKIAKKPKREPDYILYLKYIFSEDAKKSLPFSTHDGYTWYKGYFFRQIISAKDLEENNCFETTIVLSKYWYTNDGVYRESNKWGGVGGCYFAADSDKFYDLKDYYTPDKSDVNYIRSKYKSIVGYCKWEDFNFINEYKIIEDGNILNYENINYLSKKQYVAIEFGRLEQAQIKDNNYSKALLNHPNHTTYKINIIEGLSYSKKIDRLKLIN